MRIRFFRLEPVEAGTAVRPGSGGSLAGGRLDSAL